jgi:integrase
VTHASYAGLMKKHVVPELGRVKLDKLSPAHLQGIYRSRLDSGLSPRTVQYIHTVLRRALKQALRWNLVPCNVAEAVDPPRLRKGEMRPLSPPEARRLLNAARGDRLEALYVLAVHCGLRRPDGAFVARFSAKDMTYEAVEREALEDRLLAQARRLQAGS